MTTKQPALSSSINARRQPLRTTRTKPPRARPHLPLSHHNPPPTKHYAALHNFTDAIDALPAEIIRHFTLLREINAKTFHPEAQLNTLIDAVQRCPDTGDMFEYDPAMNALRTLSDLRQKSREPMGLGQDDMRVLAELDRMETAEMADAECRTILGQPETRRSRCWQLRSMLGEMMTMQDEKVHVMSTAVETLEKLKARVENSFAYVQLEIPEYYRMGSREHWAYKDSNGAVQESHVRGSGSGGGATKKDAEREDHHPGSQPKKHKKETLASAKRFADQREGLGEKKRKKVSKDKERGSRASTPVPGTAKKTVMGKSAAAASARKEGAGRRSHPTPSPHLGAISSPIIHNSAPYHHAPFPPHLALSNSLAESPTVLAARAGILHQAATRREREDANADIEPMDIDSHHSYHPSTSAAAAIEQIRRKDDSRDFPPPPPPMSLENLSNPQQPAVSPTKKPPRPPSINTAGRTSTSAPHSTVATPLSSSRSKLSARKRADSMQSLRRTPPKSVKARQMHTVSEKRRVNVTDDEEEEGEEDEEEEKRYCYCDQVSYGSMVGCDDDECAREWFHLECVGLAKPPPKNTKWFCDECKQKRREKGLRV